MRKRTKTGMALCMTVLMMASMIAGCGKAAAPSGTAQTENTKMEAAADDTSASGTTDTKSGSEGGATSDYLSSSPLRIGTMPHQMGVSLHYAQKNNLFKEAGINVDITMFSGGAAINEAIGAGELDGGISGLATVYALANNLVTMVAEVDTAGADGIVVRNDSDILSQKGQIAGKPDMYGSAETLKGKSFICQLGQAQQFYISRYISQFGLTDEDINFINMEDASGSQAYISGEGDVIGTKMPYIYSMITKENCTVAASVEDATDIKIKDCVIFTPDVVKNRREEVVIFLKTIYSVIDQMDQDLNFRQQVIKEFYAENGKEFVQEELEYELTKNELLGSKTQGSDQYYMGDGMQSVADFYGSIGTIDPANVDNVYKNYDSSLISDALGMEVKAFAK